MRLWSRVLNRAIDLGACQQLQAILWKVWQSVERLRVAKKHGQQYSQFEGQISGQDEFVHPLSVHCRRHQDSLHQGRQTLQREEIAIAITDKLDVS